LATFRIATWNLWNHDWRRADRLDAAISVLNTANPDLVALQEVHMEPGTTSAAATIAEACGYTYLVERRYPDEPAEGLAVLARFPLAHIDIPDTRGFALRVECAVHGYPWAVTTLHLDWQRPLTREEQIVRLAREIDARQTGRFELMTGDFNSTPESSIYQFLRGQMSLSGQDTVSWLDLAARDAARTGTVPGATLDVLRNPRWHDVPTLERPMRLDWILMRDLFNSGLPWPKLEQVVMFGEEPAGGANVVASDHYGVLAILEVPDSC